MALFLRATAPFLALQHNIILVPFFGRRERGEGGEGVLGGVSLFVTSFVAVRKTCLESDCREIIRFVLVVLFLA